MGNRKSYTFPVHLEHLKYKTGGIFTDFPQSLIENDTQIELTKSINIIWFKDVIPQLFKNMYYQNQSGQVWNDYLVNGLDKIGFTRSYFDKCLFFQGNVLFIIYAE